MLNKLSLMLFITVFAAANSPANASRILSQSELDDLSRECEDQREKELAPIRAERVKDCKEQGLRTPDHCERYYETYGNVGPTGGLGSQRAGLFFDLPVCQEWIRERERARASRSRLPS